MSSFYPVSSKEYQQSSSFVPPKSSSSDKVVHLFRLKVMIATNEFILPIRNKRIDKNDLFLPFF